MTTPDTENKDELLIQKNTANTKKKNLRFAVTLFVVCMVGGVFVSGWQKTLAGLGVVPITTLGFQLGVALGPFVFGWLVAKGASFVLKKVSFNTVWAVSAAVWILLGFYGRQNAVSSADTANCVEYYDEKDWAKAVQACTKAADRGDARAQYFLGFMYHFGHGVIQDYVKAVRWTTLAAEQGQGKAQYNLGVMYGTGKGVAQDHVRAHMWFNLAAVYGNENSVQNGSIAASKMTQEEIALALKNRDIAASKMTREQIAEAQKMARDCVAKNYKKC